MELGQAYKASCWRNYFYIVLLLVIEFKVGHFFKTPNRTRRDREQDPIAGKPYAGLSGIGSVKSKERKQDDSRHVWSKSKSRRGSRCSRANAERQQMRVSDDGFGDTQRSEIILRQRCFDWCGKLFFRPLFSWRKALSNISFFLFFTEQMFLDSKHSIVTLHVISVLHKRIKYEHLSSVPPIQVSWRYLSGTNFWNFILHTLPLVYITSVWRLKSSLFFLYCLVTSLS